MTSIEIQQELKQIISEKFNYNTKAKNRIGIRRMMRHMNILPQDRKAEEKKVYRALNKPDYNVFDTFEEIANACGCELAIIAK